MKAIVQSVGIFVIKNNSLLATPLKTMLNIQYIKFKIIFNKSFHELMQVMNSLGERGRGSGERIVGEKGSLQRKRSDT